ncbi:Protein kinase protein rad53 [Recurvomyces mirabilis]|uniref:non-specific serine/threonine protein kinase n=1 Tax=Recurvomyces mirabilis TaxID=574656 RepID=A0AAE0WIC0_9PEZI|nr:Protein kinase protein rad53 [Recurvomyces mirabilis]KAK5150076.1 hypothetical protein LTS14_010441 [Recurvomyces mirabilis]
MEDLIASLYPFPHGRKSYAHQAIEFLENSSRLIDFEAWDLPEMRGRQSRETTAPLSDVEDDDAKEIVREKGFQLTFTHGPKTGRGYMLGTDANSCDIILPQSKGVSRCHCYLTFDHERRLILRDCSSNGTVVTFDGKGGEKRRHFTWILGGHEVPNDTKTIVIQLHAMLKFQIVVTKPTFPGIYFENVDEFLGENAVPTQLPLGALGIRSIASTAAPSGARTPEQAPVLLEQETLGRGAYGVVHRVWDVSTGREYASKSFTNLDRSDWKNEAHMMRQGPHEHIVRLCFTVERPVPQLVMEYVPLGNLEDQHRRRKISEDEAITILQQGLSALAFLHEQSPPIVHRDIKPENLLLRSRDPVHIKLGDFGLSKANEDLKTLCGTLTYLAPEIARSHGSTSRTRYTQAVDIWSFGTVIYQYVYELPQQTSGSALSWCERIVEHLNDWESDELIDLLSEMIVMDPRRRLAARSCWQRALLLSHASTPTDSSILYESCCPSVVSEPHGDLEHQASVRKFLNTSGNESRANPAAPAERGTLLSTLIHHPKEGSKRPRSRDPDACAGLRKRATAIWQSPSQRDSKARRQQCSQLESPSCVSIQRNTIYECVVELLRDIRTGTERSEDLDSPTIRLVRDLCQRLDELNIGQLHTLVSENAERTTVIAVSKAREFTLASLTSSDVGNSVADLTGHLIHMTDLLGFNLEKSGMGSLDQDCVQLSGNAAESSSFDRRTLQLRRTQCEPTAVCQLSLPAVDLGSSHSNGDTESCLSSLAPLSRGLTYPSGLLDPLNTSGCSRPW